MKVSQFDMVASHVKRLNTLREARDAAQHFTIEVTTEDDDATYDIKEMTSVVECRRAITDVLDRHISQTLQELKAYGVDDE